MLQNQYPANCDQGTPWRLNKKEILDYTLNTHTHFFLVGGGGMVMSIVLIALNSASCMNDEYYSREKSKGGRGIEGSYTSEKTPFTILKFVTLHTLPPLVYFKL